MKIRRKIVKFITLFSVGFFGYMLIELLWRQYTFPLMGLCGGLAIVILDKINNKISWETDLIIQSIIGSIIITFFELIIGLLALHTSIPQMWDYSNIPLNFMGVICLPFSIIWCFLSVIGIFIADAINYYIFKELPVPYYKVFGYVILEFPKKLR